MIVRAHILISCLIHGERKQTGEGDGRYEILFSALIYGQERDLLQKMEDSLPVFWRIQAGGRMRRKRKYYYFLKNNTLLF